MKNRYQEKSRTEAIIGQPNQEMDEQTLKLLKSAERILDESAISLLRLKFNSQQSGGNGLNFLYYFISYLIEQLEEELTAKLDRLPFSTEENDEEYEILEEAVQKAEAEIRKHIRIEQQCKICIDTLEDKVESLEKQLAQEKSKNSKLTEGVKWLQTEVKRLQQQISKGYQRNREQKWNNDVNANVHKDVFVSWKYKKSRSKLNNEKMKSRLGSRSNQAKLEIIDNPNQIKITSNVSKAQKQKTVMNADHSLKELIKTVQMKAPNEKDKINRLGKYKSEASGQYESKMQRSNSVCH